MTVEEARRLLLEYREELAPASAVGLTHSVDALIEAVRDEERAKVAGRVLDAVGARSVDAQLISARDAMPNPEYTFDDEGRAVVYRP